MLTSAQEDGHRPRQCRLQTLWVKRLQSTNQKLTVSFFVAAPSPILSYIPSTFVTLISWGWYFLAGFLQKKGDGMASSGDPLQARKMQALAVEDYFEAALIKLEVIMRALY